MSKNERNSSPKMMKGKGPMGGGEKAKDFKGTIKQLINYLKGFKIAIIFVVIFAIASAAFSIIGPKLMGNATTEIFNGLVNKITGAGGGINFTAISKILVFLICLYCGSLLFSFVQGLITVQISQKVSYNMRDQLSKKINRMPMRYFDGKTYGDVLSRVTNDVDTIGQTLNQGLTEIIGSATTLIGVLIMMFSISVPMSIVSLIVVPISLGLISVVVKKSQKHFKAQQEYLGKINGHIEETYAGHNIVKVFNNEGNTIEEFEDYNNVLHASAWKSQFLSGMMMPIMTFVGNIGYVLVSIMGGYLVIAKGMPVGNIQSFIQYVRSFNHPIAQLAQVANVMQSTAAAAERVFEFLSEEEEDQTVSNPVSIENLNGNVEFKDVHFGYNPEKIIINDFSADIKQGQKVAIVGPTGAGKTTMVKLLMRFYDVTSGKILIDGNDIRNFNRLELRDLFGMVLQDTWLFNGTIMENIRYSKLDATDEEVIAAAKSAHVHHFVKTLPDGYNMVLNEEASNVSQGQKQLITIARAFLADPKILILDEATSSVDTRTETRIQRGMDNLMRGRTSFVIAHRLSTIKDANLILVMKDGDIIEQGTHDELLEAQGFYEKLYNSQFDKLKG